MEHRPNPENSVGPLVGIIIIVLVLVLGGLYFWGERFAAQREARRMIPYTQSAASSTKNQNLSASSSVEYR